MFKTRVYCSISFYFFSFILKFTELERYKLNHSVIILKYNMWPKVEIT